MQLWILSLLGSKLFLDQNNEGNLLKNIFYTGQLVSCIVLQLDDDKKETGKRKIWLSLRLSLLHKGFTLDAVQEGMVCQLIIRELNILEIFVFLPLLCWMLKSIC